MLRRSVIVRILIFLPGILLVGCQQEGAKPVSQRPQGVSLTTSQVTAPIPPNASPEQRKAQEYANHQAKAALERAKAGR
jgi:hypothetical protein